MILVVRLPRPMDFAEHFVAGSRLEAAVLNDEYTDTMLGMSSFFLGNSHFFAGDYNSAVSEWQLSAELGKPDDLNIACALTKLGRMEDAYKFVKPLSRMT